jgi:peroxin-10
MNNNILHDRIIIPNCEVTLRAIEKDNEYVEHLSLKIAEFYESLSNFFKLPVLSDKIEIFSKFLFYNLSYLWNHARVTPGEEYVRIKKQHNRGLLFYIISLSLRATLARFLQEKLYTYLQSSRHINSGHKSVIVRSISRIAELIPSVEDVGERLLDLQLCYFFINAKFYDLSQTIFNIYYSTNDNNINNNTVIDQSGFRLLGYLIALRFAVEGYRFIKGAFKIYQQESERRLDEPEDVLIGKNIKLKAVHSKLAEGNKESDEKTCLLCMDERKNTSVTVCGHLFCWSCVTRYLQAKPSCPFCRATCQPQQVVLLQNYN